MANSPTHEASRANSRGVWTRTAMFALAGDAALVLLFAGLGRSSHARETSALGLLETAWPFLLGLAVTWVAARVAQHPLAPVRAGLPVWLGTVAIGLLLRAITGAGVALPFVLVATGTLALLLIGWRLIAALVRRIRR